MAKSKKQRFTIYLFTLLFIWVNGVAAPYHCIQSIPSNNSSLVSLANDAEGNDMFAALEFLGNLRFDKPAAKDKTIHTAYPAEETFEEQEESHRKDEDGMAYSSLPQHLLLAQQANILFPYALAHYNIGLHVLVHKQSTYLLDCTFLI